MPITAVQKVETYQDPERERKIEEALDRHDQACDASSKKASCPDALQAVREARDELEKLGVMKRLRK